MSVANVLKMLKEVDAKFVDLRLTDLRGQEQHVTLPASQVDKQLFADGKMFDGSSLSGWKDINESDMILLPDPSTAVVDPFYHEVTVNLRCSVIEPTTMKGYVRGPRSTAKRAEEYLRTTGIGDAAYFGPENEFFLFDSVRWDNQMGAAFYEVQSAEAAWSSADDDEGGNSGHRPGVKGGYFPTPPVDSGQDIRSEMCLMLEAMGVQTEVHHHEVATGGQAEIGTRFGTMVRKADEVQIFKYVVKNVAHEHGLTATFMPKPLEGDNGSGMHVHQSIFKGDKNLFSGDLYGGLSQEALYYIGGIFKHARALNAFTNASTNSYKRLVPGFEAPTILAYSARNRSASCRIPYVANPKARRVEIRFPDSTSNPYFAFTALLMAGLDGIRNKIEPGPARDENLYALSAAESAKIPTVASSLEEALAALDRDREFLLQGDVMSDDLIDAYIALKTEEVDRLRMAPHPCEFDMYYSA